MATLIAKLPSIRRPDGVGSSSAGHQRLESAPPSPLNLRRWEEIEKQRRKAARESRASRAPSTLISDVAGYVTSFGSSKPASKRKDSRTDSVGTIPVIPDGTPTRPGGWTAARTRDSEDLELEAPKDPRPAKGRKTSPPHDATTPTKANFQKRVSAKPSQSSIASTDTASTVTSGRRNPFSDAAKPSEHGEEEEERDEPFTPPDRHPPMSREPSTSSTASTSSSTAAAEDPFKNPEAGKTDLNLPLLSTPTNLSPATSPRVDKGMLLQVPTNRPHHSSSTSHNAKRTSAKQVPPLVRPLDLPEPTMPRMEPEPGSGHWRRVQEAKQRDQVLQEELEEDRAKGGRWWTDWICGCREGNVREDQAGRTNPFE
ncbi:hypothetical protein FRB90_010629 [Tulasnella sp. 427]|nr:hypothetical protein FRB90_010629 [Tulasnella sp. 427]